MKQDIERRNIMEKQGRGKPVKKFGATQAANGTWRVKYPKDGIQKAVYVGLIDKIKDETTEGKTPSAIIEEFAFSIQELNKARIGREKGVTIALSSKTMDFVSRMAKYHQWMYNILVEHQLIRQDKIRADMKTVADLCDDFYQWRKNDQNKKIKKSTARIYRGILKDIKAKTGDKLVTSVKSKDIDHLDNVFLSESARCTAKKKLGTIRKLFRFAVKEKLIAETPVTEEHVIIDNEQLEEKKKITPEVFWQIINVLQKEIIETEKSEHPAIN